MAASLKAPADFAKPIETKTTVKTLVTPNSFHHPKETTPITEGHKKAQKTNTGFVERRGRESGSSDDLMRKNTPEKEVASAADQSVFVHSQNVPSCKEINTPSDVHQRQPQFTPQLHPGQLYHPGVHHGPHPGSYPGTSFTLPGPQPDPNLIHLKHTTEMIGRQAAEITELKTTAEKLEAKYQREVERLKDKLEETETRSREDVRRRKDEVSHQNQLHQRQIKELKDLHQAECDSIKQKTGELRVQLEEEKHKLRSDLEETNEKLKHSDHEKTKLDMKYANDIREQKEALTTANRDLAQMRVYIQESRPSIKTVSEWDSEKQQLIKKIQDLEDVVESLKATEQYVKIRLSSTQKILALQEAEVVKSQTVIQSPDETGMSILTKWREKVYAMLVQQKSQELVTDKELKGYTFKVNDLQNQLQKNQSTIESLEHRLSDREAELKLEKQISQARSHELESTEYIAGQLDQHLTAWEESGMNIKKLVVKNQEFFSGRFTDIQSALKKLAAAEQRIKFATSRVDLLKDLFARKESSWRIAMSKASGKSSSSQSRDSESQTDETQIEDNLPWKELQAELDHLRKERDNLAGKLREQSQQTERRVSEAMQLLEKEVQSLKESNSQLEIELHKESEASANLKEELHHRHKEIRDLTETNASLRINLSKMEVYAETASDEKCAALEEKYQMQLKEMEKRLNEARREHAKAVVSYRQMERQLQREKEHASNSQGGREVYFNAEMDRLKKKLRETEKDRNLLMATLKQEGLISKYKSYRRTVRGYKEDGKDEEDIPKRENTKQDKQEERTKEQDLLDPQGKAESISAMIKDVQNLAEQVLGDEFGEVT
ncbi:coiled-coil alpha-helical rod protein 1-like isoform X3 [Apostichopus japonicus]|uniref:coiled-coil alpha-helical rod protein 1-like isoform X3 n=1 Tax=Stichopus japonicus TaxID=307972 RepID=UPI003AB4884D